MKILIGYDGSECANDALEDLKNAGLPARCDATILTVTENWTLIFKERGIGTAVGEDLSFKRARRRKELDRQAAEDFAEAEQLAQSAGERVQKDFPHWTVRSEAVADFPERGITERAKKYQPDLIVVGSHGRGFPGRMLMGSFSLKILTESLCSVRIARQSPARTKDDDSPTRVVIAVDGSTDSMLAVEAAAKRAWRQDSAARLVTAIEPIVLPAFGAEIQKAEEARSIAVQKLEAAGLHVSTVSQFGAAKYILVEEAETWGADAIFLGARGHGWTERVLLGSVSYAVAARAACAVEVVRENLYSALDSEDSER
jgi:nucleotide-binding universal stress UspA family protein